jgi:2',5'-phosphodiesterase
MILVTAKLLFLLQLIVPKACSLSLSLSPPRSIPIMFSSNVPLRIRIVSYNVLSNKLASPSHFSMLNPAHLDENYRLPLLLQKIEHELSQSSRRTIICLQEVSDEWAGALHVFFANRNYHLASGLYGKPFNGYMGVCLAWPTDTMETVSVSLARLSDTRPNGWPKEQTEPTCFVAPLSSMMKSVKGLWNKWTGECDDPDPWEHSQSRFNRVVAATLRDKETGQAYVVATYHMPCAFWSPPIMTIHADMVTRHVQQIAVDQGNLPYVLAGDFNIKPTDAVYDLLTTMILNDTTDPFYPPAKGGVDWEPLLLEPMQSAYAVKNGQEPDFTNYARVKEQEPFIDTLDYIFCSKGWNVDSVLELPHRDDFDGPIPNETEPSDHILIAADLKLE